MKNVIPSYFFTLARGNGIFLKNEEMGLGPNFETQRIIYDYIALLRYMLSKYSCLKLSNFKNNKEVI